MLTAFTAHPCDVVEFGIFGAKCARCRGVHHDVSLPLCSLARSACCACVAPANSVQCKQPDLALYPYIADAYAARTTYQRALRDAGDEPDDNEAAELERLLGLFEAACAELVRRLKRANVSPAFRLRFASQFR